MAVWRQRWSGARGGTPPADALPGLWQAEVAVDLNGRHVEAGEYLMPSAAGRWAWQHGTARGEGQVADGGLPPQRVIASLLELGRTLRPDTGPLSAAEWPGTPVVLLRAAEILREPELVQALEKKMPHLAEVFRRPVSRLTVDQELLPVGRARRVPVRAVGHLAAHPEEWESTSLVRVTPRRIIAEVRDEEWAIYENRVAVRLVDELLKFLDNRIRDLAALERQLDEASTRFGQELIDSYHLRSARLSTIWSELFPKKGDSDDTQQSAWVQNAREQLRKLRGLRRKLLGLKDNALYAAIAARSAMPSDVRQTNLFRDHKQYRDVFALWVAWRGHRRAVEAKRAELDPQELCASVNSFALLCTLRALQQDGFVPVQPGTLMTPGVELCLRHESSGREVHLRWNVDGDIVLRLLVGARTLRLVAVPASLATAGPPDTIEARLRSCAPETLGDSSMELCALLHVDPGDSWSNTLREDHWLPIADRGRLEPNWSARPWCGAPISPWAVDSLERIGRLIRAWIWAELEQMYPMRIADPRLDDVKLPQNIQAAGGKWTAVGPDVVEFARQLQLLVERNEAQIAQWEAQRDALRKQRDKLELQRELRRKVEELQSKCNAVGPALAWLQTVREAFAWFACCPACGEAHDTSFEPRDSAFKAECAACSTTWGIARLSCGHRVPFLGTLDEFPEGRDAVEMRGHDVLAQRIGDRWGCPGCSPRQVGKRS